MITASHMPVQVHEKSFPLVGILNPSMDATHPKPPSEQLAWHNSRPRRWWTIMRLGAWERGKERREQVRIRSLAFRAAIGGRK